MKDIAMATEKDKLQNLVEKVQLPYQVTQLNKDEISILEQKFNKLSDKDRAKVIGIAEEIFDSDMLYSVKEGRWFYSFMYGIVEFLQEHDYQQAEQTSSR